MFRSYTQDDFDFLYGMLSDPAMVCYIGNGETRDLNEAEVFLEWIYRNNEMNPEYGLKVVVRKEDSVSVGHAGNCPAKSKGEGRTEGR
ncbi:GNAT family N-acetyltransferase [Psychrobacillus lasiicapitis]|uniref:GNAT family N-acetyltransferase n=1 Tax=Psychrobacillus lasiicapitis TaxID=1636719 RepID=A0A544TCP7_9BACI|nr:GNAT family N-acetyltransferase [Psychrobacillus lasiicapitis]TQR15247.1 GNAT family N-acetyltransferase [Psychrobacillus lasiicapitis]GGA44155.1 hypothetical protein GCM10011384_37320 [Psychrobacillus lasiicapitis]